MERLEPGLVLAQRYRLVGHVASGGMGQVWEALDDVLQRRVALKIMHPHTQDELALVERFRDEARFAAQLTHANIVTIHDFLDHDDLFFLVMEFVDGLTLAEVMSRGPLGPEQVRSYLYELASALVQAHEAGIVHRDIKPANILVSDAGAKLTDFGIARSVDGHSHTMTGQLLGTAHYLSPEHALGQTPGPASDVYGLGVLAHEMLTGEKPFDRGSPIAIALSHVQDPPPPLPVGTPNDLMALVGGCLAKDPEERPTASAVVRALEKMAAPSADPLVAQEQDPDATLAQAAVPRRAAIDSSPVVSGTPAALPDGHQS